MVFRNRSRFLRKVAFVRNGIFCAAVWILMHWIFPKILFQLQSLVASLFGQWRRASHFIKNNMWFAATPVDSWLQPMKAHIMWLSTLWCSAAVPSSAWKWSSWRYLSLQTCSTSLCMRLLAYFTGSAARATGHSLLTSLRTWVISCEYRQHEFYVRCCPQVDKVRCCLHIVHIARSAMFHSVQKYISINVWLAFSSSVFNCFQGSVKVFWNSAGLQRAGWMPSSKSVWCSKGRCNYCI